MEVTRESCRKKRSAHKFSSITYQLIVGNASVRCLNSPTSTNSASSTMLAERTPRVRESSVSATFSWPSSAILSVSELTKFKFLFYFPRLRKKCIGTQMEEQRTQRKKQLLTQALSVILQRSCRFRPPFSEHFPKSSSTSSSKDKVNYFG